MCVGAKIGMCMRFQSIRGGVTREQRYYCGNRPGKERVLRAWSRLGRQSACAPDDRPQQAAVIRRAATAMCHWSRGVLRGPRVGATVPAAGPRPASDGAQVCEAVSEERQERQQ